MPPGRPDRAEQTHVRTINQLPLAPNDKQSNSTPHTTAAASDNTEHHQHSIDVGTTSVQHDQTTLLLLPREADAVELSIIRIGKRNVPLDRSYILYLLNLAICHQLFQIWKSTLLDAGRPAIFSRRKHYMENQQICIWSNDVHVILGTLDPVHSRHWGIDTSTFGVQDILLCFRNAPQYFHVSLW